MTDKTAVITGVTGQDGSYLAELLVEKKYNVVGVVRRLSKPNTDNFGNVLGKIDLEEGDLHDQASLNRIMRKYRPDEVYNLAAQSFVGASWNQPALTGDVTGLGALRVFDAVRQESPNSKVYQAGSSEMFGKVIYELWQNEETPFHPRSPYGCAKAYAHYLAVNYRESYNMFISNGILFNHESPRRGIEFVTKKIANGVARIARGVQKYPIQLGNIFSVRDWGYAPEYVEAMWRMLQQKEPDDFVIATGETHTVKEFIISAFEASGIGFLNETQWQYYVSSDTPSDLRPAEVNFLCGDSSKARQVLGWEAKVKFHDLVKIMVEDELSKIATPQKI